MFRGGEGGPHNPILRVPTKPSAWLLPWDPSIFQGSHLWLRATFDEAIRNSGVGMEAGQVDHGNFHRKTAIWFTVFPGKEWQHHSCCLKCGFFTGFFHMFLFSFKDKFHPKKSWIFFSHGLCVCDFLGC